MSKRFGHNISTKPPREFVIRYRCFTIVNDVEAQRAARCVDNVPHKTPAAALLVERVQNVMGLKALLHLIEHLQLIVRDNH